MSAELQLEKIKSLLEPLLEEDVFLVDMRIKPTNNIKIFLDGDKGLPLERCIKVNRALYKKMEELALYPDGDFSLEVSSPGADEPLKFSRQYPKHIGRDLMVTTAEDKVVTGKLTAVETTGFTLLRTEGKGKKAVEIEEQLRFEDVKQAKVQIKF
jgi:ribosome maturation factor RimP